MQKINFVDLPSRTTPINATNLNAIQTNAENAINEAKEEVLNVELIAVTDTAPATCSTGDKYYNTTTDLIYTATGTNTWGITGESAVDGIMYIVYSKKSTYAYDGETLISVGGGSGAYIGTTEPPADDNSNVWIDPNESVNVYGNYISNSYGTSQEIGYAQEYANQKFSGVVLYDNENGTNGEVALSSSSANYTKLVIYYKSNDSFYNSVEVDNPNGKKVILFGLYGKINETSIYLKHRIVSISGTTISTYNNQYRESIMSTSGNTLENNNYIYITKVVGYK